MSSTTQPEARDGFAIRSLEDDSEVDFIACTMEGSMRERVERGLAMRVDFDRFYFFDTRDGSA